MGDCQSGSRDESGRSRASLRRSEEAQSGNVPVVLPITLLPKLGTMSITSERIYPRATPRHRNRTSVTMRTLGQGKGNMAHDTVTIIDVAQEAGVSKSAAARVLARRGSASEATREKVLEAAARLGYRPNQLARAMKRGATNTIGIVVPDVAIPFFSAVLRGIADTARAAGFEVLVSNTDNDADVEARALELLAEQRVDGIAIAPVFQDEPRAIIRLRDEGMPIVLLDRRMPGLEGLPLVSVDHAAATEQAVRALIDHGHTRIALVTEVSKERAAIADLRRCGDDADLAALRPSAQRFVGYLRALTTAGIEVDEDLIIRSGYTTADSQRAVEEFLGRDTGATALHATDAVLSSGAFRGIRSQRVPIPERLSFIGFDDGHGRLHHGRPVLVDHGAADRDRRRAAAAAPGRHSHHRARRGDPRRGDRGRCASARARADHA